MVAVREEFDGSLEQAYRAYSPMLRRRSRRWLPADEVEDAVQETFLRAWAHHQGRDPGIPWMLTVLRNLAIDRSRRNRTDPVGDLELLDSPHEDGPENKVIALDERRAVRDAIRELTDGQKRALHLREWEGMSHQEIADSLGTTVPSVESLLVRGRRRMRGMLEKVMAVALWPATGAWRRLRHLPAEASVVGTATPAAVSGFAATVANLATAAAVLVSAGAGSAALTKGSASDGFGGGAAIIAATQGGGSGSGSGAAEETRFVTQGAAPGVTAGAGSAGTGAGTAAGGTTSDDSTTKQPVPDGPQATDDGGPKVNDPGKTPSHHPTDEPGVADVPGGEGPSTPGTNPPPPDEPAASGPSLPGTGVESASISPAS